MKKKIIIVFLALFAFFTAGVLIALQMVFQTTESLDSLITLHKVEIIRQEVVINVQAVQANLYTTGTLFGKELDVIVSNVLTLDRSVIKCSGCHHQPEVAADIRELQELTDQYQEALSYFITSTADRTRVERLQAVAADIGEVIIRKSQDMAQAANETLLRKTRAASAEVRRSKNILMVTLLAALMVAIAVAVYLIRSITRPVAALLDATRKIKSGNLGYRSSYQGHDEFKELISSFNEMSGALQENNEKILGHMARNQAILQTSTDGFLLFDENGRILDVNPAICTMTGYAKDELLTMFFSDIEMFNPENTTGDILEQIKEANSMIFQVEQKNKKGQPITVEISATYTGMDGTGNFFCFIRNITNRQKMEEEILKVQKLESLGVLAGGIAHDFNNLLTGILGNIDLAIRKIDPGGKTYRWLKNAISASQRAQGLTQQLLTFSRGGAPVKQAVQIAELVDDAARFILSGSNVRCEIDIPDHIRPIEADKGQIGQVIQNIILNANQAMPSGGVLRINGENILLGDTEMPPLVGGEYIIISFADQGGGIEKQHLKKIFDPYFTTKQTGSGLGLTICHSIISKHLGLLKADSTPGVGTTFSIYLPAMAEERCRPAPDQPGQALLDGTGRVLVMDDEEHVLEVIREMLKKLGYEAVLARDGAEAVALYEEAMGSDQPFTAVIMDLTIPGGMGGKETIGKILALDPQVKAIVSSGYSFDPIMADHRRYGFMGMVVKPYDVSQLGKALNEVIKGQ